MGSVDMERRIAALEGQVGRLMRFVSHVSACNNIDDPRSWMKGRLPYPKSKTRPQIEAVLRYGPDPTAPTEGE